MSMHAPLIDADVPFASTPPGSDNGRETSQRVLPIGHGTPMQSSFAQFRFMLMGLVLACAISACATLPPPTAELATAQQSLVRAEGADADQYASTDIATARQALARAQAALADGRADDARRLALAAAADADLAYARSIEALTSSELAQRRAEIEALQQRLQTGDAP